MDKAVITGFQVFGQYANNPTEQLVRKLSGKILSEHIIIHSKIIPISIFPPKPMDYGRTIAAALGHHASAIISFGISSDAKGVRVESRAVNWVENAYCSPEENRRAIDPSLPNTAEKAVDLTRWNLDKAFAEFEKHNIPFETEVSENAGRYCCNALMFRTLCAMEYYRSRIPYLFVHVPCTESCVRNIPDFDKNKVLFSEEQLVTVAEILLDAYHSQ